MLSAFVTVAMLVAGVLLPGYCLARRFLRDADPVTRWVLAAGLGWVSVSTLTFWVAWLLGLPVHRLLVLGLAAGVVLACRPWSLPAVPRLTLPSFAVLASLLGLALVLLGLTDVRGVIGYRIFDSCLYLGTFYVQHPVGSSVSSVLFAPDLGYHLTYVLSPVDTPVFGWQSMIEEARMANAAALGTIWVLAGRGAIELTTLLVYFLIAGAAFVTTRQRGAAWLALAVGAATLLGLHGLIFVMVNETTFALVGGMLALALLLKPRAGLAEAAAAGLFLGFAVGSRLLALWWLVPLLLFVVRGWRDRLALTGALLVSVLPWMLVPWILKGTPFFHPSPPGTTILHSVAGLEFWFRPLNWPFHHALVRLTQHALPPLLFLPALSLQSLGSIVASAMALGFGLLWRPGWRSTQGWAALVWSLPIALFMHALVYLDYEKASWLLLAMPVTPLLLASFASSLVEWTRRRRTALLGAWALMSGVLALVPGWLTTVELPQDDRRYNIAPPNVVLPPETVEEQRQVLGRMALLPGLQRVRHRSALWRSLASGAGAPFESGRVLVILDEQDPTTVSFPVEATDDEPRLPDLNDLHVDWVDGQNEMFFSVHLRVDAAPTVRADVSRRKGRFSLDIDPGPPPHQPRYVSFLVNEHWSEGYRGVQVSVAGQPLPVKRLGYRIRFVNRDVVYHDLWSVTNLPPHCATPATRVVRDVGYLYEYEWTELPAELPDAPPPVVPSPAP